ncbi:MAG: acetyl-CoA carboxylase biotin carboxylase subunit [Lachnospiraceae bacterium]|nr:acetyl-CoA carboxylase biotin carboxylase subunit [Lachnospiraceae bacterium]
MFKKILIANRGEIAVRIVRACREMGIPTVAVYSEADNEALATMLADEAICIGPAASASSYLSPERILSAAIAMGADAIHPGFGFLSENSRFARMCEECHIRFIGPDSEMIARMGSKAEAKNTMQAAGVPVVPGCPDVIYDAEVGRAEAARIGYPVMVKTVSGGGGKGMRIVRSDDEWSFQFAAAQRESEKAFGDAAMYLEKYVERPRHVEVQILADAQGHAVYLGERDCTVQRHHQKVIEESPCPALTPELRRQMGETAVAAARAVGYENAGTVEFLLDSDGAFYFMEMNTRIQVEHPVTEVMTGIDLIQAQIRIAAGEPLPFRQEDICPRGWAMECRINAEDPDRNFMPCPGTVTECHFPGGMGIRVDSAVYTGCRIPPYYDSMLVKLIAHGATREETIRRMEGALEELVLEGVTTNQEYLKQILRHPVFRAGEHDTSFLETCME